MTDDYVDNAVRRRVGIDALRRLRRQVDGEAAQRDIEASWARRLSWFFGLAALLAVVLLAFR